MSQAGEHHDALMLVKTKPNETAWRLMFYFQVVKALVPGHDIDDDDPEQAVVEALERIEEYGEVLDQHLHEDGVPMMERARELAEEVKQHDT